MIRACSIMKRRVIIFIILLLFIIVLFSLISSNYDKNINKNIKDEWNAYFDINENETANFIVNRTIRNDLEITVPIELYTFSPNELFNPDLIEVYYKSKKENIENGFSTEKKLVRTFVLKPKEEITFSYKGTSKPRDQSLTFGDMKFYNAEINFDFDSVPTYFTEVVELPYSFNANYSSSDRYIPSFLIGSYFYGIDYIKNNFNIIAIDSGSKSMVIIQKNDPMKNISINMDLWAISVPNPKSIIHQTDEIYLGNEGKLTRTVDIENNQNISFFYQYDRLLNILNISDVDCEAFAKRTCKRLEPSGVVNDLRKEELVHTNAESCSILNWLGYPFECWKYEFENTLTSEFEMNDTRSSAFLNYQLKVNQRNGFGFDIDKSSICVYPRKIQLPVVMESGNILTFNLYPEKFVDNESIEKCSLETGFFTFETPRLIGKYFSRNNFYSKLKYYPATDTYGTEKFDIPMAAPYPEYVIKTRFIMVRKFEESLIFLGIGFIYLIIGFNFQKRREILKVISFIIVGGVGLISLQFLGRFSMAVLLIMILSLILGWIIASKKYDRVFFEKVMTLYSNHLRDKFWNKNS